MATARLDLSQPSMPDDASPEALSSSAHPGSLLSDVEALVDEGKTYAEAELAFQKSRAVYAAGHAKWAAILGGVAAVLVVLAIVVLVVGTLIGLIPLLGPWGATGAVFGALAAGAAILIGLAKAHWSNLVGAFAEDRE